jgi:hypothetical protein
MELDDYRICSKWAVSNSNRTFSLNIDSKPDEVTMVSVISAYGHPGALELSNWVVNFILELMDNLVVTR